MTSSPPPQKKASSPVAESEPLLENIETQQNYGTPHAGTHDTEEESIPEADPDKKRSTGELVFYGVCTVVVLVLLALLIKGFIENDDLHFDFGKAFKSALGGGLSGAAAMVLQVLTLMPLRTVMNYQYRYGTSTTQAIRTLYRDGGWRRYYQGLGPALIQGPVSRFGDTAANVGILALLDSNSYMKNLPSPAKTVFSATAAAAFRMILTPIDTLKTTMQTQGREGLSILKTRIRLYGVGTLWYGALGTAAATFVGYYPWFGTYNYLKDTLPVPDKTYQVFLRQAFIGFVASVISDTISNFLRVLKTYRQVNRTRIGYWNAAKAVIRQDGYRGLFGRGLKTRILANGLQGLMFSVLWKLFLDLGGNASDNEPDSDTASLWTPDELSLDIQEQVTKLAAELTTAPESQGPVVLNPFVENLDPAMDPRSKKFDHHRWIRSVFSLASQDPEQQDITRTAGVSFRNMNVYGFGKATDYQKTVGNVLLDVAGSVKGLLGQEGHRIDILTDFEGIVQPGELLLVLGPPGSGCSTFLKTIAGDTHGFCVDENSKINYQGIPYETMHKEFRGECLYNAEQDCHFPNLTVGQTLAFAAKARTPHTRFTGVSRDGWANHMKDVVMAVFGLTHAENTKVGNDFIRGVSGGERKRVSIAEAALSGSPLQCWDNSTRGLDSATALEFVKTLRLQSKYTSAAVVVAIYQASQAIYDIFDKVTVLYEGRQIYFGRAEAAKQYFVDMGFECPERQTTADFLTSLTNPAERRARPGFEHHVPRTPEEFVVAWKKSDERRRLVQEMDLFNLQHPVGGEQLAKFRASRQKAQSKGMRQGSPYTVSLPMQVRICLSRGFQRLRGDIGTVIGPAIGNFILALIISSVFFNLPGDTSSFFSRGALLFYAVLMNGFSSALEILTLYDQRPIVEKHARMALISPGAEALSSMICDLPSKIATAITFNITLYFMANLRREPDAFFIFFLFSFVCTMAMSMIFRTIGAVSRTIQEAQGPASIVMLSLVIYTGFTIPVGDMRPYLRWINFLSPLGYVFESLMVNEFDGRDFPCVSFLPAGPGYDEQPLSSRICSTTGATAGSSVVSGTNYLEATFKYTKTHLWRNLGLLIMFVIVFCGTYILATEYITAEKSKGEVLVFRRGQAPPAKRKDDEEAAVPAFLEKVAMDYPDTFPGAIQKPNAVYHWEDVCFDVTIQGESRRILDNVDGWVAPGKLTALMGASGAGKTTLLDVLANRASTGVISGSMFVDGKPRDDSFQRKTGYAQQQDVHLATSTVREALTFSARLRQPRHVPDQEKVEYVSEVIRLLGMEEYADAIVGVPGEGLNIEQRKRLTIGVELAAKPQLLLFLDEPTSGLDSQTAWSICTLLRKLANNGQAILCTIHQPSGLLFQEFDRLLFLARGGRTVYFGDIGKNSRTLVDYFERQGASPCPPKANPAEWMLQVIGAAPGSVADKDYAEAWRQSPEFGAVKKELQKMKLKLTGLSNEKSAQQSGNRHDEFAAPFWVQFYLCTQRVFQQYWRSPSYIYSKFGLNFLTALLIGISFSAKNTIQGLQNQLFAAFMLFTMFGNVVNQILPNFVTQRSLYEVRERPSKMYSWKAFMIANILTELAWNALMGVIMFLCWYYPIGFVNNMKEGATERSGLIFLLVLSFMLFTSTFAHLCIAGVELAEAAGNISSLAFSLCFMFCGVLSTPDDLPRFWIWMYRISPFTYLVDGLVSTGLANGDASCSDIELSRVEPPSGMTCDQYLSPFVDFVKGTLKNGDATSGCEFCPITSTNQFLDQIQLSFDHRWRNFGIVLVFVVFNIFAAMGLYWLARVPKGARGRKS
ncbi:Multidrug resistance protein [Paramarasmius palmivorus]|uniref:Multidrug resistance protein n=1 Tax=Paramarasmius palmivorus TaxID=297713 RepID=A0AAW0D7W5_9AGAR